MEHSVHKMAKRKEFKVGTKIEEEHEPTYRKIKAYLRKFKRLPPKRLLYYWIALDHIKEYPKYYTHKWGLIKMEKLMKRR